MMDKDDIIRDLGDFANYAAILLGVLGSVVGGALLQRYLAAGSGFQSLILGVFLLITGLILVVASTQNIMSE